MNNNNVRGEGEGEPHRNAKMKLYNFFRKAAANHISTVNIVVQKLTKCGNLSKLSKCVHQINVNDIVYVNTEYVTKCDASSTIRSDIALLDAKHQPICMFEINDAHAVDDIKKQKIALLKQKYIGLHVFELNPNNVDLFMMNKVDIQHGGGSTTRVLYIEREI